jgi:GDP-4-dehydro-6-deoxy-D-mannose reductase
MTGADQPHADKPMRVFVTGAGGFVGKHLCARLADDPLVSLIGTHMDAAEIPAPSDRRQDIALDITNSDAVTKAIQAAAPDCVMHLAAISSVPQARANLRQTYAVNFTGTLNLVDAVQRCAPKARFVFVSTSELYGASFNAGGRPLDETALPAPQNPYAASKAAADLMICQMAADGMNAVRLRPFNHTGAGQTDGFVVPAFAAQIARIEVGLQPPILKVGNLDAMRDFLDLRDVLDAYLRVIFAPDGALPNNSVFNIASGTPRRIRSVLDDLLALARVEVSVEEDPARMRPNDMPFAVGDATRIKALLGWHPRIPWTQTLADVLNDWRTRIRA